MEHQRILLTGATGYIGSRLVPRLVDAGYQVRCVVRNARKARARKWAQRSDVDIVECDVADTSNLERAMQDCGVAYYLVHSMIVAGSEYADRDYDLAESFSKAARSAGVQRIIYLGGLGEEGDDLSRHLQSRRDVEHALQSMGVPVTTLRAAMIIGSGSASFEILRYLVERLPVMVTPRWVSTECQPIAVRDVLFYLTACLVEPKTTGKTLDIGGPDVKTYRDIMDTMSDALGLRRRLVIPVPVLTPKLSSLWIHLVTPVSHRIARPLAEGLRNRVVCRHDEARHLMPHRLLGVRDAIESALGRMHDQSIDSSWSDAGVIVGDPDWAGGTTLRDHRSVRIDASAETVYATISSIGGDVGYFGSDWLWRLRGWMDRCVGGPGLRRGRRHPSIVVYGDAVDFWRVVRVEAPVALELRAEMKLPGVARLCFHIEESNDQNTGICTLHLTAEFHPRGLPGIAYWYLVLPLHSLIFPRMLRGIRAQAEAPRAHERLAAGQR